MYIKFMNDQNKNVYISFWLMLITSLVGLMIIVGGLTRLTDSGLSITRWDLISGILPPLSLNDWEGAFSLYKKIPEFKLLNSSMTIDEFKTIYLWEYAHRLLGRILGIFYIIPLIYFTLKKSLKKKLLFNFYMIFFLIFFQGIIGWYMVKSGLTERTDVSHYRLSLHLTLAFIIFICLLWNFLKYTNSFDLTNKRKISYKLPSVFLFFLLIQVCIGALVSGLDGSKIYQTWPLMNESYFPDDSEISDLFRKNVFSIPSLVQFLHRNIAYFIFAFFLVISFIVLKNEDFSHLRKLVIITLILLILQIFLGILTVLTGAQIILASMHQIGSILLITTSLILVFKNSRIN